MGDAGDEVSNVFVPGERRQGLAVGSSGVQEGTDLASAVIGGRLQSAFVYLAAKGDGGVLRGGAGWWGFARDGRSLDGFGHGSLSLGGWNAAVFFIVREGIVIICKPPVVGRVRIRVLLEKRAD